MLSLCIQTKLPLLLLRWILIECLLRYLRLPWVLTVCCLTIWRLRLLRGHTLLSESWGQGRRLMHRLYALITLRIEARVYRWLGVRKLLRAALERSMLRLLPCGDVRRRRNIYTRRRISIRRHV